MLLPAGLARGASSTPPSEFAGVTLGTSLRELKQRHPEVKRNPESDRQFQVYQTLTLKDSSAKGPVAFDIYQGRVVGGQVMLDSDSSRYWYDRMVERYGNPDNCTYCTDPELVSANWMWGNGVRLHIGGGMLTMLTEQGAAQRREWVARGDSDAAAADNGDEESDLGGEKPVPVVVHRKKTHRPASPQPAVAHRHQTGWQAYYQDAKSRVSKWLGWSK
jgi:hypothetical protein